MITKEIAIQDIKTYIESRGAIYTNWYIGIASDPTKRLTEDHNVKHDGTWQECKNSDDARSIEEYFLRLGCKGDIGGGDYTTKYVYAYKITPETRE